MKNIKEGIFTYLVKFIALFSSLILIFIIGFILLESVDFFKNVSVLKFISKGEWNPLGDPLNLSIYPIVLGTFYVSIIAILIAIPVGVGTSLTLALYSDWRISRYLKGMISILAGIPSVIYGFIGLTVIVKFFEDKIHMSSGESVLSGGILLSIMVLPYIVSTCSDCIDKIYNKYTKESLALGISKIYFLRNIVLREGKKSILAAIILAFGRAMGETMAVMMVIGNAPIMPKLMGKCQTISSLIALEMGMAEVGSLHYHALFSAGFILMIILIVINILFYVIQKKIEI